MRLAELLERGRAAARWRWTPTVAVALLALVLVCRLDQGRRASEELATVNEKRALDAEGLLSAERETARWLADNAEDLLERYNLQGTAKKARKVAKGERVVETFEGSTGPLPSSSDAVPRPSGPPGAPAPVCLYAAGDQGEIRQGGIVYETKAGNRIPIIGLRALRVAPGPETLLFGGELRPDLSRLSVEAPERPAGWGFGAVAGCGRDGCGFGPGGSLPPLRVSRWQVEVAGGLQMVGRVEASASATVRRWR